MLTIHCYQIPKLKICGGIPLLRLYAFIGGSRDLASLFEEAQWRGPRGWGSFTGDLGRYV